MTERSARIKLFPRQTRRLFPDIASAGESYIDTLMKTAGEEGPSKQGVHIGERDHPFDFAATVNFKNHNAHHSTCIETKTESMVGLGFENDRVAEVCDPLCEVSFQDVMNDIAEDFWQTGNGWMEVVRLGDEIVGLHHVPTAQVKVVIDNEQYDRHYLVRGERSNSSSGRTDIRFAKFGEKEEFMARAAEGGLGSSGRTTKVDLPDNPDEISELIHFRRPTSLNRYYGFPDWLAAVASVELEQCLTQHTFDFFLNRGVPEFMLFLLGGKVDDPDWEAIEEAIQANIGLGNSHKSAAFNIPSENITVQLERLAMEGANNSEFFSDISDALAMKIVSAHRVPPLLAGIQIPGKLGATNELPNALMGFQVLVIGPGQKTTMSILDCTLGDDEGIELSRGDFGLKKITDEIDLGTMDTVSRMRQTAPEAAAEGRDLADGLRD